MKTLDNNDFMILNNIIYKIHTNGDFFAMRREFLEQMKMVMDFDSADFYLAKGDGSTTLGNKVAYNCPSDVSKIFEAQDYSQGILSTGRSMVYRESDILSEEKRIATEYYQNVYKPNNWHYALQLILGRKGKFLGAVTFYRHTGQSDFRYDDVFLMEIIKDHMAHRLFTQLSEDEKITVADATIQFSLTKRETQILELLLTHHDNQAICGACVISNNTLKKHILNIYRKLDVKSRPQLLQKITQK